MTPSTMNFISLPVRCRLAGMLSLIRACSVLSAFAFDARFRSLILSSTPSLRSQLTKRSEPTSRAIYQHFDDLRLIQFEFRMRAQTPLFICDDPVEWPLILRDLRRAAREAANVILRL
jgi:hypothetical protein